MTDACTPTPGVCSRAGPNKRVLLCLHGRFGRWVQLGGHCEPGDPSLAAAALREATATAELVTPALAAVRA